MTLTPTSTRMSRINWLQTSMMFFACFFACLLAGLFLYYLAKMRLKTQLTTDTLESPDVAVPAPTLPSERPAGMPATRPAPAITQRTPDGSTSTEEEPPGTQTESLPTDSFTKTTPEPPRSEKGRFVKRTE